MGGDGLCINPPDVVWTIPYPDKKCIPDVPAIHNMLDDRTLIPGYMYDVKLKGI